MTNVISPYRMRCSFCKGKYVYLIFVDFEKKKENERPDFYILTVEDWKELLKKELVLPGKVERGEVTIDDKNMPTFSDGFQGMGILPKAIKEHQDRWDKITSIIEEKRLFK